MKEVRQILEEQIDFDTLDISFKQEHSPFKMSIKGVGLHNSILEAALQQSILSNLSNVFNSKIYEEKRRHLHQLFKQIKTDRIAEEQFKVELKKEIIDIAIEMWEKKLVSNDIPTPAFPTSVAYDEAANYYISSESYTREMKITLINRLADSYVGRCGNKLYGLYIPEEPEEAYILKEWLKDKVPSFYRVNISDLARVGKLRLEFVGPFEFLFYLLDEPLKEMYQRESIPSFHVELFTIEKRLGRGKISFSHHVIPSLDEIYFKLYHGDEKYTSIGSSKVKSLVASFLPENWKMEARDRERIIEEAHKHIDSFLYCLFICKTFDLDSFLLLEELKLKSGEMSQIWFVDEVMSWILRK